jgi:hypothetical protein
MVKIFGDFNEKEIKSREFLKLGFMPSSVPLQQRWRNNGLSADFLADYLMTFFPSNDNDPKTLEKQIELKSTISYIANELLENVMKFNDDRSGYPISIQVQLYHDHLNLCISNSISAKNVDKFQSFIKELLSTDPEEFYIRQMERANEDGDFSSGLGLLTMIDDYGAKLGWRFENFQVAEDLSNPLCYNIKKKFKFNILAVFRRMKEWFSAKNTKFTVVTTMVQLAI